MADLLKLEDVRAGYGEALVLNGISLRLEAGHAMALLGRNGTGKTTLINTIVGATRWRGGSILFDGNEMTRLRSDQRAHRGIGWVPQERNIFKSLTVEENLTAIMRPGPWGLKRLYEMFPRLAERKRNMGNQLSGGEQQMLAVARALALNPRLLLLDEPLEGLAPIIVDELLAALRKIIREEQMAAIVVEQSAKKILPLTDSVVILERGAVVYSGQSTDLAQDADTMSRLLGVAERGGH
ncbi:MULTISPECIES: ABC transporter ATP-binding protein [unclassified Beijerinckia]|uniref:ABC transporter ATP-binding protein n=1 Tax=unclassified Beijerinckia TaxID=2638183 RepID=UPI00089A13D8|nr:MULTISPECIES: ABC transporter ATP-binding protein [unclassified Beijerinckia]MDH7796503.1 branched-chain amino acid transport system ATP-binding protein [Beijerinckia sp. GAS462]SEC47904.1 amino acid/amide ABC transporter ATP-binding protein 2, HAAT family [Beijerinckia sp. 28-YEA-48]